MTYPCGNQSFFFLSTASAATAASRAATVTVEPVWPVCGGLPWGPVLVVLLVLFVFVEPFVEELTLLDWLPEVFLVVVEPLVSWVPEVPFVEALEPEDETGFTEEDEGLEALCDCFVLCFGVETLPDCWDCCDWFEETCPVGSDWNEETGIETVALSGGVFQNKLLLAISEERLSKSGLRVLRHSLIAPNDGGLSTGQVLAGLSF